MRKLIPILLVTLLGCTAAWAERESRHLVWTLESPKVTGARYAVTGTCSLSPNTNGHYELLNHFPGRGAFFTRKPLKKGKFELPFDATDESGKVLKPTKLELFLVTTQGGGTVQNVQLEQR